MVLLGGLSQGFVAEGHLDGVDCSRHFRTRRAHGIPLRDCVDWTNDRPMHVRTCLIAAKVDYIVHCWCLCEAPDKGGLLWRGCVTQQHILTDQELDAEYLLGIRTANKRCGGEEPRSAHARRGRCELRSVSRTISRTPLARLDWAIRTLRSSCPTTVVMTVCGVINV